MSLNKKQPIWTKNFIMISTINFFLFVVFYALMTTLPIYVVDNLQKSEAEAGLVATAFLISAILFRPFSGKLLDVYGKKHMLIICMILFLVSTFMYIWVNSFYPLLALRFLHGMSFSIASVTTVSIVADMIPSTRRGEGIGYFVMSQNLAIVAGPFISLTLLQSISFDWLFSIFGIMMLIGGLSVFFIQIPKYEQSNKPHQKLTMQDLFEKRTIPIASVAGFIYFSYASVISFISVYAKSLHLTNIAGYFFVIFAFAMLISRPFAGKLFDEKGQNIVVYPSIIAYMVGLMILSFTSSAFSLLLAGALIGLGIGTLLSCFQTIAVQSTTRERSGHATATLFTFTDTGVATGAFVSGWVVTLFGYEQLYLYTSIFVLFPLFLYWFIQERQKKFALLHSKQEQISK